MALKLLKKIDCKENNRDETQGHGIYLHYRVAYAKHFVFFCSAKLVKMHTIHKAKGK